MEAFMGTILPVAFNFAPIGWALCNGQTMSVNQNQALFVLIGKTFGGDGVTTFGLPDLRGRVIAGSQGANPALTNITWGQQGGSNTSPVTSTGSATVTIGVNNLPAHTHNITPSTVSIAIPVSSSAGNTDTPGPGTILAKGTVIGGPINTTSKQYSTAAKDSTLLPFDVNIPSATQSAGAGQPLNAPVTTTGNASTMQPFLGLTYIICLQGLFPTRD